MQKRKKNTFYFNGELDLAGNITGLVTGANVKKDDTIKIFDVPFSQYVKMRADFRHYLKLRKRKPIGQQNYCWSWDSLWKFKCSCQHQSNL